MSSGHLAGLHMQVDGGKDTGESCSGEVMTTWCHYLVLHPKSATGKVMGGSKLSPGERPGWMDGVDPSASSCCCD